MSCAVTVLLLHAFGPFTFSDFLLYVANGSSGPAPDPFMNAAVVDATLSALLSALPDLNVYVVALKLLVFEVSMVYETLTSVEMSMSPTPADPP